MEVLELLEVIIICLYGSWQAFRHLPRDRLLINYLHVCSRVINNFNMIILRLIITGGHHILRPENAQNMDVEDPVAELDPSGENLYENSAERDDPTPSALQG